MRPILVESLTYDQAQVKTEVANEGRDLYMKGLFIEGDKKNHNGRIYGRDQIASAVKQINEQITGGYSVLGEVDHPANLRINLDRVSHMIDKMWCEGPNGYGKMKILPTPMGNIVRAMLDSGVKLGVSSRGSGEVDDTSGKVSDFEIVTVDIVAQPSAPNAYPTAVYESLMNMKHGHKMLGMAAEVNENPKVQKYLKSELLKFIDEIKIR
jgi:hypothetical protein